MQSEKTHNIFEFDKPSQFFGSLKEMDELDCFLDDIWKNREKNVLAFWNDEEQTKESYQKFLAFSRKSSSLSYKCSKYVGIIKFKDHVINLLPKVFNEDNKELNENEVRAIQSHILWWLSYCSKFKFPKTFSNFNHKRSNFFEVLIFLFASYTSNIIKSLIYHSYEEVENDLTFLKGRLDFPKYISRNFITGNKQKLPCIYSSFEMDNSFNRIVKYVSKLLLSHTSEPDNKKHLSEIIFTLDEVTDIRATIYDCEKIKINPLFKDLNVVLDYCKLFLSNSSILSYKNQYEVFAFLLPMEYIFEDFIYGFIKSEMKIKIKKQSTSVDLTTKQEFALRPDLVFNVNDKTIIADTKYKMIYPSEISVSKHNISQSDIYQLLAYAIRNKTDEVKLFYPSTVKNTEQKNNIHFEIKDEFSNDPNIKVDAYQLPIILNNWREIKNNETLATCFISVKEQLKEKINEAFSIK